MTNEEILKKAIDKAVLNGWSEGWSVLILWKHTDEDTKMFWVKSQLETEEGETKFGYKGLIFSHNFAKAFWGSGNVDGELIEDQKLWDDTYLEEKWLQFSGPVWQFHLQQMVVAEDPIKYLEKFL